MKGAFALILWPFSQDFIGREGCFFYTGSTDDEFDDNLSQGIFVPSEIMDEPESANSLNGFAGEYDMFSILDDQDGLTGQSYDEDDEDEYVFVSVEE